MRCDVFYAVGAGVVFMSPVIDRAFGEAMLSAQLRDGGSLAIKPRQPLLFAFTNLFVFAVGWVCHKIIIMYLRPALVLIYGFYRFYRIGTFLRRKILPIVV